LENGPFVDDQNDQNDDFPVKNGEFPTAL